MTEIRFLPPAAKFIKKLKDKKLKKLIEATIIPLKQTETITINCLRGIFMVPEKRPAPYFLLRYSMILS